MRAALAVSILSLCFASAGCRHPGTGDGSVSMDGSVSRPDTTVVLPDGRVIMADTGMADIDSGVPDIDTGLPHVPMDSSLEVFDVGPISFDDAYTTDDVSTTVPDDAYLAPPIDAPGCNPTASCASLGYECGSIPTGCGTMNDCGTCPAGTTCNGSHRCQSTCIPLPQNTTNGGGLCGDLNQAYTARGINVGYYPFRVRADIQMYSGDYDGTPGTTFMHGATRSGVLLQTIRAGAYIGLSSNGPWYDPPSGDCSPSGQSCGDPGRAACGSSAAPPIRPPHSGYYWGYAYSGASHMQGWIPADFTRLVFAGTDPHHPCARGPAGLDFEVPSGCGIPTQCAGGNATCAATNPCSEGGDDCGRTECGAMSGGELTPSAWHRTVTAPTSHACSAAHTLPNPSVRCFANGTDQDFFNVYPFGAYLYWAQNSTTKAWLHYGDHVQAYYHTRDAQGVLWDFVEVTQSGAPTLTPPSDGAGASSMHPCMNGGTCGWVQDVFLAE